MLIPKRLARLPGGTVEFEMDSRGYISKLNGGDSPIFDQLMQEHNNRVDIRNFRLRLRRLFGGWPKRER